MRMKVILDSCFACPGSAPIGGGKKGEFRDWTSRCKTKGGREERPWERGWNSKTCGPPFANILCLLQKQKLSVRTKIKPLERKRYNDDVFVFPVGHKKRGN